MLDDHWIEAVRKRHPNLKAKTEDQVLNFMMAGFFEDYYGRVNVFDPETGKVEISFPLPTLSSGQHTLTLQASDIYGNTSLNKCGADFSTFTST